MISLCLYVTRLQTTNALICQRLMLPRLYNRFFIDFTIDSSFIDSTIDSSLNLQLILHWHYNQFVLKPSLIPFNSSWFISEYFIHPSLTLHQFLLSNFHQLFFHFLINSPRILWISFIPSISYTSTILRRLIGDLQFIDSTFRSLIDSLHSNQVYLH